MKNQIKLKILFFRIRSGDKDAFSEFYDLYADKIYQFIYFRVSSREDAEDLVSEVFLKMWKSLNNSDKKVDNLNAFIYQTARNSTIDYYRTRQRQEVAIDTSEHEYLLQPKDDKEISEIELSIETDEIRSAIQKLPEDQKEIIVLKFMNELSNSEISAIIQKTSNHVRVLSHRAIKNLKNIIKQNRK